MGEPLRITSHKDERYSRVTDRKKFNDNFDDIHFPSDDKPPEKRGGRTRIVYKDGKRIVAVENGKQVQKVKTTVRHRKSGVSMYDILTQPNGPDSEPTTMTDITEAAKAAGVVDKLNEPPPEQH